MSFMRGNATSATTAFSTVAGAPEVPKLRYTPCVRPPAKPTAHRERLLWYLSPTPEIIEDFRIEQKIEFQRQWCAFNDRTSRPYYDKLTDILLKNMLIPLSKAIENYNECLSPKGYTVANCPLSTVVLSMMLPSNMDIAFTLPDVESFISLDGFGDIESRRYVIERIKELASSNKMAAFRFTPKVAGMPTDSAIILHIFKHYLSIKEPYAIPPLILPEGDIFKFLLIYIKITPE
ncbi:hypothetical protein BDF20DRAFT_379801 [Mycotypha africana]|uniref:uncharacterized protein n=1 Tax=Mycotypha africana TaxID=64632 RepID=UPI00230109BB|nr:uncharacterized protein BDF20DRAFT_379801 [Mycotypha africana]KAI8984328.1 hypothetical protein BDF20DRAFT_379801 [Mycotypha africana]